MELERRLEGMFTLSDEERTAIEDVVYSQTQQQWDMALGGIRLRQCPGLKGAIREALVANDEGLLEELSVIAQDQAIDGLYRKIAVWKLQYKW